MVGCAACMAEHSPHGKWTSGSIHHSKHFWKLSGVQYPAPGHFNWTGGAGNQISDPLVTR